ncbi:hypothetical protein JIG36_28210 [Actinoplanes sp. LDG1-06]|uniref:Uncharacterized protein n=1 Tax=Paractinoplanes ovalisporus TaxID=2810368 RepID=A0ABS2AJN2_9ACTN|nr:hypothetical protein [Actinoplanes ovalisporus]MBM2619444.1 hypothetical protein [Actinoplanes ovalisporus]
MRRLMWIPAAVLTTGLLLTGCGSSTGESTTTGQAGTSTATDDATKRQNAEKEIADCMKAKGFQYEVPPPLAGNAPAGDFSGTSSLLKTDDELREFRKKYGFGIFAQLVWPDDPMVKEPESAPNPNNAIRSALDPARQKAYDAALGEDSQDDGCATAAYMKHFGTTDPSSAENKQAKRAYEKYRTDAEVVKAARQYADCLTGQGYKVASAEPGRVENGVYDSIVDPLQDGGDVTVAQARKQLPREVEAALADLDCRGAYAEITRTRYAAVATRGGGEG